MDGSVKRRARVASGPFPSLDGRALEQLPGLEQRLPLLFMLGFIALVIVQVGLRM